MGPICCFGGRVLQGSIVPTWKQPGAMSIFWLTKPCFVSIVMISASDKELKLIGNSCFFCSDFLVLVLVSK